MDEFKGGIGKNFLIVKFSAVQASPLLIKVDLIQFLIILRSR